MKQIPQDQKAEKAILGSMLLDSMVIDDCNLSSDDFFNQAHQIIFDGIIETHAKNGTVDLVTILDTIPTLTIEYYHDLKMEGMQTYNFKHWEKIVTEKSELRKYIDIMQRGLDLAFDGKNPEKELEQLDDVSSKHVADMVLIKTVTNDTIDHIKYLQDKTGYAGISTGLRLLDYKLDGLQKNKYCLLAARPSMGKTALMLQIANGVASKNKNVAIYSLEMEKKELTQRLVVHQSQVHLKLIKDKKLDDKEWNKLKSAAESIAKRKIYIDDTFDQTIATIYKSARKLKKKLIAKGEDLDLVMIDYIQLLNSDGKFESENKKVSHDSRQIKKVAKDLDTCVIALSQLSRSCESRDNKRPQLSDLRDSGSLEQDADIVMFLYRDDYYAEKKNPKDFKPDRTAEVSVSKNRAGETGTAVFEWNGGMQTFYNK